ncbi:MULTISPECIES: FGGY family carbohydrate kinase [unclassified Streptomyces]|uniref:FGGY family carbohydrate kinase n=1 Tax=Streptomyces sp. NPDC055082 TaxID=3365718 RepID=UPI0037D27870
MGGHHGHVTEGHLPEEATGVRRRGAFALCAGILDGLKAAGEVDSVGIDSWAVDYGLLDADGHLLSAPVHYRDTRTDNVPEQVWQTVPAEQLYARAGIQHAPFNTLYQLVAAQRTAQASIASGLLLIPDLITYWLTGEQGTEVTNASATQLLDASTGTWAEDIARPLGIALTLFAPLHAPGDKAGTLLPDVLQQLNLQRQVPVRASEPASPLAYPQGSPMLPEVRPHLSTPLTDQLEHQLGPASETGQLDVERVAGITVVAAAHSGGYAAIGHLLGLLAALPVPTGAGERFRSDLWRSSGTVYLLPGTLRAGVLESLTGEGTTLARQILSAVDEMTPPQRLAAGEVIGQALIESDHLPDLKAQVIGELWLRDLELTAWHVLHADSRSDGAAGRKTFLEAWSNV